MPLKFKIYAIYFLLAFIFLFSSCDTKRTVIANRQQDIKEQMEKVKKSYFKKQDSLENVKQADTNSAKRLEIATELVTDDREKSYVLIRLQKEYDSLDAELKKQ